MLKTLPPGEYTVEYHDATHLPEDQWATLAVIDVREPRRRGESADQVEAASPWYEVAARVQVPGAGPKADEGRRLERVVEDQLAQALVRAGLLRPSMTARTLQEVQELSQRQAVIIVPDTNALCNGSLHWLARSLVRTQLWVMTTALSLTHVQQHAAWLQDLVRQPTSLSNLRRALRSRTLVNASLSLLRRLRERYQVARVAPSLLRYVRQSGRASGDPDQADVLEDRLLVEAIHSVLRPARTSAPQRVLTSDITLARVLRSEAVPTLCMQVPRPGDRPIPCVRFEPVGGGSFQGAPLSQLLWELAHTFASVRQQEIAMSTLQERLKASIIAAEQRKPDPFWERFGLTQNPFPPSRTIIPDLLHDQQHAIARFAALAGELFQPQPQRRALAIVGGTGVGKTHFLRHCLWAFEAACTQGGRSFALVYLQAGVIKAFDLVVEILDQADRACVARGETDLVTAVVAQLAKGPGSVRQELDQAGVEVDDLRHALERLVEATDAEEGPTGRPNYDQLRELFLRWIRGQTLTQSERNRLGVWQRIATASYGIRVLRDLLALARALRILEGVLLCLDELETVFASGRRSSQYLPFLHDLRYFFDEAVTGSKGFALLVVSGCTEEGARKLQDANFPLFERLGFKEEARVVLREISGVVEAREFAYTYIDHYHKLWQQRQQGQKPPTDPRSLLSEQEIEQCYWLAARVHTGRLPLTGIQAAREGGYPVTPAALLEQLHRLAEQKRAAQSGQ